jgi:hypothetical protein
VLLPIFVLWFCINFSEALWFETFANFNMCLKYYFIRICFNAALTISYGKRTSDIKGAENTRL